MNSRLSPFWERSLLPAALTVFLLAACFPSIASADFWWHLRTGQFIFASRAVPHTDPFSFTAAGRPWVAHEWLSELIFYLLYRGAGFPGLLLTISACTTLAFALIVWRSPGVWPARLIALALAVAAARPTFSIRPQAFSLLLFALFLTLLDAFRQTGLRRWLFFLPPVTLLWVNLHGAYILGPALILLFLAGSVLDSLARVPAHSPLAPQLRALALTAAACFLLVPLNPNGARLYTYPFETLRSHAMRMLLMEWRPPDPQLRLFWPFFLLLAAGVAAILIQRKRLLPSELLVFTVFALVALHSMRYLSLFAVVSIPILAGARPGSRSRLSTGTFPGLRLAILLLSMAISGWRLHRVLADLAEVERARFPADAVTYLEQHQLSGPLFNSYSFGGYLIWRLYPRYRVFVDGRADLYGDGFLNHYVELYEGQANPRPEFDRLGIRTVIIEPSAPLGALLAMGHDWKKVYEDRLAVIYSR